MPITWWSLLIWLFALVLGAFLVTWVFADLLRLTQTVYIGVLAVVTGVFLYGYLSWSNIDWGAFLSHQWVWGLVGAVVAGPVLIMLLAQGARRSHSRVLAPTPRPEGLRLAGALLWEGLVYGTAEGLLLSVLPVLVTWQAVSALGWTQSWMGVVSAGVVAIVVSLLVIVVHHLGYREFRGPQLAGAMMTCGLLSLAYLLTMNPLAAAFGHSIAHSGAILHGTELPPHQESGHSTASKVLAH
ncbi:MAG TPA: hypothetical protein VGT44_04300 [Ktedonobacteraceae bacterium]|nr:hypothetical protein [Ktedonobacteraceae bacterium]